MAFGWGVGLPGVGCSGGDTVDGDLVSVRGAGRGGGWDTKSFGKYAADMT